jgi:cation:H+ antiporter
MTTDGLPLDTEQRYELVITAAQSLFAVALLIDKRITSRGAWALLSLFLVQFLVSVFAGAQANRITIVVLSALYVVLAVVRLVRRRRDLLDVLRDGTIAPLDQLPTEPVDRR